MYKKTLKLLSILKGSTHANFRFKIKIFADGANLEGIKSAKTKSISKWFYNKPNFDESFWY